MSADLVIFHRLFNNDAIKNAVKGAIYAEYRKEYLPAIVYDLKILKTHESYDDTPDPVTYGATISVIMENKPSATATADLITTEFHDQSWVDGSFNIMSSYLSDDEGRVEDTHTPLNTKKSYYVVDLKFELLVMSQ